jgi:hypothetical protein
VTSADSVVGSHQEDVSVSLDEAADQEVSSYDDASFTLSSHDGDGRQLGTTVVAEGSPFVTHTASRAEELHTSVTWTAGHHVWSSTTPTATYGMTVRGGTVDGDTVSLRPGGRVVFFPVPSGEHVDALVPYASGSTGTSTSYDVGTRAVTTSLSYGRGRRAFVALPGQVPGLAAGVTCDLGSFASVYGPLRLCHGRAFTWSVPRRKASAGLDLSALSGAERRLVAAQVSRDVAGSPAPPDDTYEGGKWLYRQAQLLELAGAVGADHAAARAGRRLTGVLEQWTAVDGCRTRASRCFVYDPVWKGIVGQHPSFGSEEFNDHHFHYGYFLYAAGVLAAHDPSVVDRLRPVMDLLAADIAGGEDTGMTPRLRVFDVYAGHSWASGTAAFADGNNQESSSEAVNAWAGLSLWAEATRNGGLSREAAWLLSAEAAAARTYWTRPSAPPGFGHRVFGITWGGKRDYATWFSADPSAILGIQLIPMSPSSVYLAGKRSRIRSAVAEAGGFDGPLGDYVAMYSALAGGAGARAALRSARTRPDDAIDTADSRSYLMAFALSHE